MWLVFRLSMKRSDLHSLRQYTDKKIMFAKSGPLESPRYVTLLIKQFKIIHNILWGRGGGRCRMSSHFICFYLHLFKVEGT